MNAFNEFPGIFGIDNLIAIQMKRWPAGTQLVAMFVIADFIQWNTHRALHRFPWMWEFHKVHHSVEQMGFAAHLRFHWMETIIYKTVQYVPLAMIGFGLQDFFIIQILAIAIGHLNHSNINITYGPLGYILNNPAMHIWHHTKVLPNKYGVNYGISLSIWDYLFGTSYIPRSGRDERLGFEGDEKFPKTFWQQISYPFKK